MFTASQALRASLLHPSWQLAVGLPALAMAALELGGNAQVQMLGTTIGAAHGLLFVAAAMVFRGAALSILPAPPPKVHPSMSRMAPYAPLKRTRPQKALPPPLPDNIIPFQRTEAEESGPEAMA